MKTSGLKKHSFWLLFGAVPLLVGLGVLMILSSVGGATAERKKEYDAQKDDIAKAKPKGKGVGVELSKQKGQLDTKVTALWGENFQQQKNAGLFKWPNTLKNNTELAILEKRNLPFGDDLVVPGDKDPTAPNKYYLDANQSELAEFATANVYLKAYKDMADKVFPTRFGRGGPAAPAGGDEGPAGGGPRGGPRGPGGMAAPGIAGPGMPGGGLQNNQGDGWQAVLRHVTEWGSTAKPTVPELWLALEDIWVQRELLAVVERTNKALTQFEPEFAFWNYNPLKRTFVSRLWAIDLEVVTEASRKYLKATVRNPNDRLQMLGASKVMRLKVWLDNPADAQPSLPDYVIGGELVPGRGTMDVPLQKTDPRNKVLPGSHAIPLDRLITRISKVEQILDEVSVPVKLIQALELGVTDHRRGVATFVAPKLKGLPEEAAAADPNATPAMPGPGGRGLGGPGPGLGEGGPGGPPGGGVAGAGQKSGPKEAVLLGNKLRYVEATDQVRRMPVALSVVLDLAFEQDLLVQFTNSPMRFHVTQTGWQRFRGSLPKTSQLVGGGPGLPGQPGPGQPGLPGIGGDGMEGPGGFGGPTSAAVTAQANAGLVTLAVYGVVSLYNEMPLTEVRLDATETFEAGSNWKEPTKVSTDEELAKLFPDAATQAKVRAAFDLRSHDLLAFAWEGPAGDKVTFTVADQAAKFGLAPGEVKDGDKVQHRKLFAVRRTVKWSVE